MTSTLDILDRLIRFDTTSHRSNRELIDYLVELLSSHGIDTIVVPDERKRKANLYCTIGPSDKPGVMLSGHTDVVPVSGQAWTRPPFELTEFEGRLYGRGTTDMKGFVACAVSAAIKASRATLKTPLHLAFSYDEEIGCVGVRSLLDLLRKAPLKPAMCIVGEPTNLTVANRHKGKSSIQVRCIGREAHSSMAPSTVNAIHLACDVVSVLRNKQRAIMEHHAASHASSDQPPQLASEIPYTTIHAGNIVADQALNIVPNLCTLQFEIRHVAADDPVNLLDDIKNSVDEIVREARKLAPEVGIEFDVWNAYPGLDTPADAPVVRFVKSLLGANNVSRVAFGTEAGLFSEKLGIPSVVCGPGSMEQGHKPDEFVALDQLEQCETMLDRLLDHLQSDASLDTV